MQTTSLPSEALTVIHQHKPNFKAKIGIILGSGLGKLAEAIEDATVIPYDDIPGFGACTVAGHQGKLHLGWINKVPVVCLQGRAHYYEGKTHENFKALIRTVKLLGCDTVIITNASGSLREEVGPGSVVMINDHINMQHFHPLIGPNDADFGPRFVGMEGAYDQKIRQQVQAIARREGITLPEGVYIAVNGPTFETPAEIRAFRILGADVVGMSTVPEVILARHCGLRVLAFAAISNYAAGMRPITLSHETTLAGASLAADTLFKLVFEYLKQVGSDDSSAS